MGVNGRVFASVRRTIYIAIKGGHIFRVGFLKILELIVHKRNHMCPVVAVGRENWRNGLLNRREFWRIGLLNT